LWDSETGHEILTVFQCASSKYLSGAGFSSDGQRIFILSSKGELIEYEAFPWSFDKTIFSSEASFNKHLELLKRKRFVHDNISMEDIGW